MKRIVLWFASTVSVLVLLFGYRTSTSGVTTATPQTSIVSGPTSSTSGSGTERNAGSSTGSTTSAGSSGSSSPASGSTRKTTAAKVVTGAVASTEWGPVQVRLTIVDGSIKKVTVLQYPNGNPRDAEINSQALPILIQETTNSQNANIDMVSGATVTSTGYIQSLQSALDQAGL